MCIDAHEVMGWWTADALVLGSMGVSSAVYGLGVSRLWKRVGVGHGVLRREALLFALGQLTWVIALVSPLDRLSDILFSAHMTQHELLLVVAPPLIVLGRPLVASMWALPERARFGMAEVIRHPWTLAVWRRVSSPLFVLLVHAVVIWLWHVPSLFEEAMRDERVHAVQHVTFFVSGVLFWWAILRGRYGRAGYGLAVLFVFATAAHTSVLGVVLTVADRLMYPIYSVRGAPFEVDPNEDQKLAGLVMWIPAGTILALAALALFASWLGESRRRVEAAERRRRRAGASLAARITDVVPSPRES